MIGGGSDGAVRCAATRSGPSSAQRSAAISRTDPGAQRSIEARRFLLVGQPTGSRIGAIRVHPRQLIALRTPAARSWAFWSSGQVMS